MFLPLKIQAKDKTELEKLINLFINDQRIGNDVNDKAIDISQVSSLSSLFLRSPLNNGDLYENFNGDIGNSPYAQL